MRVPLILDTYIHRDLHTKQRLLLVRNNSVVQLNVVSRPMTSYSPVIAIFLTFLLELLSMVTLMAIFSP